MPLINAATDEMMDLQSFCDWVEAQDPLRLQNIATWPELWKNFHALHNTPGLFCSFLADELEQELASFQSDNRYSGQSFILARRSGFYLRVNLWPAADDPFADVNRGHFDRFYVYGSQYAHDHNFDFLTIGLHGPGYQTDLWTYDNASVAGSVGEQVALTPQGRQRLAPGTMLLFRKSVDVHAQWPPETLSVSLNFIPEVTPVSEQYLFDIHAGRIASIEELLPSTRNLEVLVRELGDSRMKSHFEQMKSELTKQKEARRTERGLNGNSGGSA
ncbi:hypothetical protein [Stenotrophomonas lactitubi]|uniref:hypothetical protein n=1 Tax=Stenotrophomonas lactitubi TaxID=2045214 RepID=UPI00203AE8A7|nr:hypothetical protein [Stenotrophomonas lactitubi]